MVDDKNKRRQKATYRDTFSHHRQYAPLNTLRVQYIEIIVGSFNGIEPFFFRDFDSFNNGRSHQLVSHKVADRDSKFRKIIAINPRIGSTIGRGIGRAVHIRVVGNGSEIARAGPYLSIKSAC